MTICVSVKVSEGLVLAADSTAVVQGMMKRADGPTQSGILKTYGHARKLSHVKDYPIGTLSWGIGLIGSRSVESLIKEYEYSLVSLREEEEKLKERRMRTEAKIDERPEYSVQKIAMGLREHICGFYHAEFAGLSDDKQPPLGILVSGYSSGQFFPEQWLIDLPRSAELTRVRPDVENRPDFGANWYGLTDAIVRLHWGRDDQVMGILAKRFQVSVEEIQELLSGLQYPVLFDGMPLQDAIDYAIYLVNVAIGRFRFVVGAPLCGGEIDVAAITPDTFTWIQRKSWKARDPLGSS
jgi:hypothetical protein